MYRRSIQLFTTCTVVAAVILGGFVGSAAAAGDETDCTCVSPDPGQIEVTNPTDGDGFPMNEAAAAQTRTREAFLKAKKAFHEARQDIQAIKKGNADPEDVPSFFDDDTDDS